MTAGTRKVRKNRDADLSTRLMTYSMMTGAVLAHGAAANAAVNKTTPNAVLDANGETFNVVFGGQTKFQIRLATSARTNRFTTFSSYVTTMWSTTYYGATSPIGGFLNKYYSTQTYTTNSVGVFAQTANAGFVLSGSVQALNGGATVDSGRAFQTAGGTAANMAFFNRSFGWTGTSGAFLGTTGKYLGLRFQVSGVTHYGWVQVNVNSNASQVNINTQAWEDVAGLGIITGSEVSLPVETTQVTAESTPEGIVLHWATESEMDHLGFVVERRAAGQADAAWETVASYLTHPDLQGQGNRSSRTVYAFTDVNVETRSSYEYRITDVDIQGKKGKSQIILVNHTVVIPQTLALHQNYPNPFNPSTRIRFDLPEREHVKLSVYSITGQVMAVLIDDEMNPGMHEARFDAVGLSAGLYFCELKAGERRLVHKMHLIK